LSSLNKLQNNFNKALKSGLHNANYKPEYKINKYTEDLNYQKKKKVYLQYANYFILSHCNIKNRTRDTNYNVPQYKDIKPSKISFMAVVACGNKWKLCSVMAIQGIQTVIAVKFRSYS
jgi:hypothetical protein